ncbi:SchA/CurD-like domain-containing protein [Streptomyces coelicoflavus]|uniref:WhiE I n=1 Tax=Streptomyces coelicoflavus TaxID=285562 RepID=A0A6N9UV14_9ACTN|nr:MULTISPECIES: SchA/CurD-like domain-containing protein [Streptomyces]EHN72945.1 WhiE I-like protein [Streptomyces coelicoflavus ZG0656]KPC83061.1 WhiE I [Streptomyces sp. NRRL WC-3753]MZE48241.1 WhiE I [Streptomyces sp. SID5477]NEB18902.1 WhiE I [Streptomyces coelicoflavus]OWA10153.1 WhiE I [Streptomyces sp. CS159]
MQRYAITFRVRPGTEEAVKELLMSYRPPKLHAADGTRLLGGSVFMKDGQIVRMIEIDGTLDGLIEHLSQDASIQEVERRLDEYLVEEDRRAADTPDGARAFFRRALMEHVTTRRAPDRAAAADGASS